MTPPMYLRPLLPLASALLCLLPAVPARAAAPPAHSFAVQGNHFTLDGKHFQVLSGELHYARIPRAYWHARLRMARAMGLNTIATYVFWNVHEPAPGQYDFSGNNDLVAFLKAAQQEGLYVILRSGPYSCAEWDLGGLPAWLLANPASAAALRSNDPAFMVPAERWIRRLAQEVTPLQVANGGPVLMTQIENEYGNFGADHAYMEHLLALYRSAGFNGSLLYTADNWRNIANGSIPELPAATNFGIGNHQGGMDALARLRPEGPLFVSEYWPGWFDHWGHPHETRPIAPQLDDLDYILHRGAGINIYMFHGGTSFGFMAGSSLIGGEFQPDVSSYDYDAPLDESGRATPKFFAYRKELAKFSPCGDESCLPPVPQVAPAIRLPAIPLRDSASLWSALPPAIASPLPLSMEHYGESYGYILYRTQLSTAVAGDLTITGLHDFAQVYLDGRLVGSLDRRDGLNSRPLTLPLATSGPARLDILVADDGRINSTRNMRLDAKGITGGVTLAGSALAGWQVYPLPMPQSIDSPTAEPLPGARLQHSPRGGDGPRLYRGSFQLEHSADTFLDVHNLGKGAVWINGHALGRFWKDGPQETLYGPGPWLHRGQNEILVFDLFPHSTPPEVSGLDHPILDAPTPSRVHGKQE
ncbi:MAG: beta-galactosidase [Acidobacteriota bacterium]|nr:beta-galactosidase [Acidobacteriota bacterium]